MSLRCEPGGDVLTVCLTDAKILDASIIDQIHQEMVKILSETEQRNVTLDFREVKFLSSAALGMLILVNKMCKEYKINLKLCNIEPDIAQIFKITGMNKVFKIYKTAEDARAAFQKKDQSPKNKGFIAYPKSTIVILSVAKDLNNSVIDSSLRSE